MKTKERAIGPGGLTITHQYSSARHFFSFKIVFFLLRLFRSARSSVVAIRLKEGGVRLRLGVELMMIRQFR